MDEHYWTAGHDAADVDIERLRVTPVFRTANKGDATISVLEKHYGRVVLARNTVEHVHRTLNVETVSHISLSPH